MKRTLFTIAVLVLLTSSHAQPGSTNWFSIKGFLPEWNNATVQVLSNGALIYNGTIQHDLFSCTGKIADIKEGLLKIIRNQHTTYLPLFIEPGTIKIRDEGKKLVAYGTTTNDEYNALMRQFDSLAFLQSQLRFEEIKRYKRQLATSYIKQSTSSPISIKLLADYFYQESSADDTLYYQLFNSLDTAIRQSFTGKKLEQELKVRYAVASGRKAPLLALPDSALLLHSVYEPGHYTLLNFWASWCVPCKREHPALIKLFKRFNELDFTIVSISLDTNRSSWMNAIKTEKLQWLQLNDLKGWNSPAATFYGVKLIPYNILLDANGTVIGKNLRPEAVEAILSKTMGPPAF